jgi:DNA-binding transcriptional MerR regulator
MLGMMAAKPTTIMASYSIRDLEKLSGIKAHTIRIWEKRYGLIEPRRTTTNIRTYCDSELKKLLNISLLNRNGIKISKIARFSTDEINEKINSLSQQATDTQSQIEGLTLAMVELDEMKFEKILNRSIIQFGFEETIVKVMYPFFVKVGLLWQTGSINPAQEHFISSLIRQKVYVAIDSLTNTERPDSRRMLFYLPEGELHELGILFFTYLAKKRGHAAVYLGQSLPLSALGEIFRVKPFDALVTAFISPVNPQGISDYINELNHLIGPVPLYISGNHAADLKTGIPSHVTIIHSPAQFVDEMEEPGLKK